MMRFKQILAMVAAVATMSALAVPATADTYINTGGEWDPDDYYNYPHYFLGYPYYDYDEDYDYPYYLDYFDVDYDNGYLGGLEVPFYYDDALYVIDYDFDDGVFDGYDVELID